MTAAGRDHPSGYRTPEALWTAVQARARTAAPGRATTTSNLQRQFVYDRFLERVFTASDGSWVLKGGTALLARVRTARHSKDIDLFRREGTLETAVGEIRAAAALDLGDHLNFLPGRFDERGHHEGQPGRHLATLHLDAYAGVKVVVSFTVDIVTGSVITEEPDRYRPQPAVTVAGMVPTDYLLYPVADHVADKVCATVELHDGRPSSRVRDLVDLVVIARTQTLGAAALSRAIEAERITRALDPITGWASPPPWSMSYAKVAKNVAECAEHRSHATATALVEAFLNPVLTGQLQVGTWDPAALRWQ